MYEKMLYDQYKKYSYEELKEITVANGYTEEAEEIARQLLGEKEAEYSGDMKTQEEALAQEDASQNSDYNTGKDEVGKCKMMKNNII